MSLNLLAEPITHRATHAGPDAGPRTKGLGAPRIAAEESARLTPSTEGLEHAESNDPALEDRIEQLAKGFDSHVEQLPHRIEQLLSQVDSVASRAFRAHDEAAALQAHRSLFVLYGHHFSLPTQPGTHAHHHPLLLEARRRLESAWLRQLLIRVQPQVEQALSESGSFKDSFVRFCTSHRLANHPFFDFAEHAAKREDLAQFFLFDSAVVLRFFDLLAMSLIGTDDEVRAELCLNLADEMGNGDPAARHTQLFRSLLRYVGVDDAHLAEFTRHFHRHAHWQCLAGHNLYLLLGTQRRYHYQYLGCLGSAELLDAGQYAKIVRGCRRVGWDDAQGMAYYTSHAEADLGHGLGWLERVMLPLVNKHLGAARELMLGTALRLETAASYYDSLLAKMSTTRRN
jgi:pyrroloquinoline quinone (PQQ) biosynthesis protein C